MKDKDPWKWCIFILILCISISLISLITLKKEYDHLFLKRLQFIDKGTFLTILSYGWLKNIQNFFSTIIFLRDRAYFLRNIFKRWFSGLLLKTKIYSNIRKLKILTQKCSGFNQISLDRSIFRKHREKKMLHTFFRKNILRSSKTSLVKEGSRGFWDSTNQENETVLHNLEKKKVFWFLSPVSKNYSRISNQNVVSLSEFRTKWLDNAIV